MLNARPPDAVRYVLAPDALRVLPHAAEGLRRLAARGFALVVITNQRGVATGRMTAADLDRIHAALEAALARAGVRLDALEVCPHDDGACGCRKPAPGMLLRAADRLGLDLARSVLVGDDPRDLEAGRRAGVPLRVLLRSDGDLRAAVARVEALLDARAPGAGPTCGGGEAADDVLAVEVDPAWSGARA